VIVLDASAAMAFLFREQGHERVATALAAALRPRTDALGLGLGDRACLALAQALGVPAMAADRAWANLDVGVDVVLIR